MPRHGCLNIHASLLPRWRGAAPIQRAILAGDAETGITIMQMDEGLDTGAMLHKKICVITADETAQTLHDKLSKLGAEAIIETLRSLEAAKLTPEQQDEKLANYASKLTKAEAQIDWSKDSAELERAIRGYNPFPNSYSNFGETPIKILRAHQSDSHNEMPGTVIAISKENILVACGHGALALELLQKPGGKALPAAQFIQGFPIKVGDHFSTT
jgi:methionyl-tRNA formyltransferase